MGTVLGVIVGWRVGGIASQMSGYYFACVVFNTGHLRGLLSMFLLDPIVTIAEAFVLLASLQRANPAVGIDRHSAGGFVADPLGFSANRRLRRPVTWRDTRGR
jgi:hypothetical protein